MGKGVSAGPLLMAVSGGILAWTGLSSPTGNPRDVLTPLLSGRKPGPLGTGTAFSGPAGPVVGGSNSAIASDALRYQGAGYVWDGAPANGIGIWDCSSFANWVVGHDERLAIPGYPAGTYDGTVHGPNTLSWLAWTGCTTIGHSASDAQAGDLVVWQTHMGIAIGADQMISAQDSQSGTQVSGIGMPGELLYVRRLNAEGGPVPPRATGGP